jgi:hypothetical protein
LSVPSTAQKARPGVAPGCGDPREGGGSYPPRRPSRAGRKVAGRVLQRWPCKEEGQEGVADADTSRAVRPRGAHGRRGDGGRVRGPLPQMRERRALGGVVGRGAAGVAGARTKQPPEVVGYSPPHKRTAAATAIRLRRTIAVPARAPLRPHLEPDRSWHRRRSRVRAPSATPLESARLGCGDRSS